MVEAAAAIEKHYTCALHREAIFKKEQLEKQLSCIQRAHDTGDNTACVAQDLAGSLSDLLTTLGAIRRRVASMCGRDQAVWGARAAGLEADVATVCGAVGREVTRLGAAYLAPGVCASSSSGGPMCLEEGGALARAPQHQAGTPVRKAQGRLLDARRAVRSWRRTPVAGGRRGVGRLRACGHLALAAIVASTLLWRLLHMP
mmetsp:Transcript_65620/g.148040  ORF Transcript_65620/g.148040 Transcript_65620/m.148040 type:complete len:201 (-) Transcript_65620:115-717(-)